MSYDIEADLAAQGLGDVDPAEVEASHTLFERHPLSDPDFVYDPAAGISDDVYAPTAAEMEPDRVPPRWPRR